MRGVGVRGPSILMSVTAVVVVLAVTVAVAVEVTVAVTVTVAEKSTVSMGELSVVCTRARAINGSASVTVTVAVAVAVRNVLRCVFVMSGGLVDVASLVGRRVGTQGS